MMTTRATANSSARCWTGKWTTPPKAIGPGRGQFNDGARSAEYRDHLNRDGSFSDMVAKNYVWRPGTELVDRISHQAA